MSVLRHGMVRLTRDHATPEAYAALAYIKAQCERLAIDPRNAAVRPLLREMGRLDLELGELQAELLALKGRTNSKRRARMLSRDRDRKRLLMLKFERQLISYAGSWHRQRLEADARRAQRRAVVETAR